MKVQTQKKQYIDPVCHLKVARNSAMPSFDFDGNTYYFCAEKCQRAFKAAPDKYLGLKQTKKKGVWGRYLDRLNKVTGGKTPSCCH
jgi:Cu+-exporting ATPase